MEIRLVASLTLDSCSDSFVFTIDITNFTLIPFFPFAATLRGVVLRVVQLDTYPEPDWFKFASCDVICSPVAVYLVLRHR